MKHVLTKDQYDQLDEALGFGGLRPDYSGRGMYGALCLGYEQEARY
jgi:hypothetical protein